MSDFFAGLGAGFRFPDTQMNSGPLPSIGAGAPAGAGGDPDGRINFNSTLLEGITPYSYAKGARVGSDRNYQQVPHRIQQIVHQIWLPSGKCPTEKINVSHVVDQGDIAFVINSDNNGFLLFPGPHMCASDKDRLARHPVFANLATVNYILAGVQRVLAGEDKKNYWKTLRSDLGMRDVEKTTNDVLELDSVLQLVKTRLIPYGICAGSEKQGGQTETGMSPVQAGVNFVTTMTVDGQNIDLINYWAHENLSAGDQLIFKLERKDTYYYGLNHYYKETRDQTFSTRKMCWQLVPSVFRMGQKVDDNYLQYDYRTHGYWRIAQLMQSRKQCSNNADEAFYWNDDKNNLRSGGSAQLLQVLFAPVYKDMRVSNMPLIYTLFEKVDDMSKYSMDYSKHFNNRTVFDNILQLLRCGYEMNVKKENDNNKKMRDNLIDTMKLNKDDEDVITEMRNELKILEEAIVKQKEQNDDKFQEECREQIKKISIFGMNEDKCLALDMTCVENKNLIIDINSSTDITHFKGVSFSGLSVQLLHLCLKVGNETQLFYPKRKLNICFIRPDTLYLNDLYPQKSKYISNTVDRNCFKRYNDQILMGFLLENIKHTLNLRCDFVYRVSMEHIRLNKNDNDVFSGIYRYHTTIEVKLYDSEKNHFTIGYRQEESLVLVEMNYEDNNFRYVQNVDPDITTRIQEYEKNVSEDDRDLHCTNEETYFVVDMNKFVLDYERQKIFFGEDCPYADTYRLAMLSGEIQKIANEDSTDEKKGRTRVEMIYGEKKGYDKNRKNKSHFESQIFRTSEYWKEIEKYTQTGFENFKEEDLEKYYNFWLRMQTTDQETWTENEKKIYAYVLPKWNARHDEEIERLTKRTFNPSGARGGAGGGPPPSETKPAADGVKPATPETVTATDPVQAVPLAAISAAAQPAAKRSKVSLARQQAANAPMDAT